MLELLAVASHRKQDDGIENRTQKQPMPMLELLAAASHRKDDDGVENRTQNTETTNDHAGTACSSLPQKEDDGVENRTQKQLIILLSSSAGSSAVGASCQCSLCYNQHGR